jgi:flagellar basal-body rod protein FlgB
MHRIGIIKHSFGIHAIALFRALIFIQARELLDEGRTFWSFLMIGGTVKSHIAHYVEAMNLRTYRQQVLASNIANADTPYYKARDFDFKEAYAAARKGQADGALSIARTHAQHLVPANRAGSAVPLSYRAEHQSSVDGNTVDMDRERGQIADNGLQYQILAQMLSDRLSGLRSAIASNQG